MKSNVYTQIYDAMTHTIDENKGEGIVNGRIASQATDDYYLTGFNFPFQKALTHIQATHLFK